MEETGPVPRTGARSDLPPLGHAVGFLLSQLGFTISRQFGGLLAGFGIEPRHFGLLRLLHAVEGLPQNVVADRLEIPQSTLVSLIDHLEERGLAERRPDPHDRRARTLHLTTSGAALMADSTRVAAQFEFDVICAGFTPEERSELLDCLQRVAANLGITPGAHPGLHHGTGQIPCCPAEGSGP